MHMSAPTVGQPAPSFKLPSAQGPEVSLDDYRARKKVIVWFTKGMACVFCRQHMSQLARAYDEIRKRDAEVLEIAPSTPEKGRLYASRYKLPFPYLCDPDDEARQKWQIAQRSRGPAWYVGGLVGGLTVKPPANEYGNEPPGFGEIPKLLRDDDMGFFIVDRGGIVRYAYSASYADISTGKLAIRPIPANDEILRELERCA
jgi:peroxiredoxin